MKVMIYTGGEYSGKVPVGDFDLYIAADSGYKTARAAGVIPQIIVGDFDSLGYEPVQDEEREVIKHPYRKDETDTMLAASVAVERGADEIVIFGGIGGRADHSMSNVFLLETLRRKGVFATITDGDNEIKVLTEGDTVHVTHGEYRYFSTFSLDRESTIDVECCEYPLQSEVLRRDNAYAVSNETKPGGAKVSCKSGTVVLVKSEKIIKE